jgi:protocatechuate 3,4-dioxygenase, alpha subunit
MSEARQTPSQTVGPFFKPSLIRAGLETLVKANTRGERIVIEGRVLDGDGAPVEDAMLEIWQANAAGRYDHPEDASEKSLDPNFHGFGRAASDGDGFFRFRTIMPGPVPASGDAVQAPHINRAAS